MTGKKQQNPKGASSSAISKDEKAAKRAEKAARMADVVASMNENLSAGQPTTTGQPKKHAARTLIYILAWTMHAATGKQGTNLLLKVAIHAWEKDNLKDVLKGLPVDGIWYDKKEKTNMSKVSTPELAEKIVANIKQACPTSAANMTGTLTAPPGYEPPVVRNVIVDQLTVNGEMIEQPTLFFVGKMFVLKDSLKDLFSVRYGDIEFGGRINAAWYVHITDGAEETIASWLRSMGWRVEIDDLRDEPNDDE